MSGRGGAEVALLWIAFVYITAHRWIPTLRGLVYIHTQLGTTTGGTPPHYVGAPPS